MLHQTQGLPSYIAENPHIQDEQSFVKTCRKVSIADVPTSDNVICSHIIYKSEERDNKAL